MKTLKLQISQCSLTFYINEEIECPVMFLMRGFQIFDQCLELAYEDCLFPSNCLLIDQIKILPEGLILDNKQLTLENANISLHLYYHNEELNSIANRIRELFQRTIGAGEKSNLFKIGDFDIYDLKLLSHNITII